MAQVARQQASLLFLQWGLKEQAACALHHLHKCICQVGVSSSKLHSYFHTCRAHLWSVIIVRRRRGTACKNNLHVAFNDSWWLNRIKVKRNVKSKPSMVKWWHHIEVRKASVKKRFKGSLWVLRAEAQWNLQIRKPVKPVQSFIPERRGCSNLEEKQNDFMLQSALSAELLYTALSCVWCKNGIQLC